MSVVGDKNQSEVTEVTPQNTEQNSAVAPNNTSAGGGGVLEIACQPIWLTFLFKLGQWIEKLIASQNTWYYCLHFQGMKMVYRLRNLLNRLKKLENYPFGIITIN